MGCSVPTVRAAHQSSLVSVVSQCAGVTEVAALTTMSNTSLINPPLLSLAVTFTETVSTSVAAGVPVKARVAGVKVSHVGRFAPSPFVAV